MRKTNENTNYGNSKFNNIKKFVFSAVLGVALFSISPLSVYADGFTGGGSIEEGESKSLITYSVDDTSVKERLQNFCSFWSAHEFSGYESLKDFDTEASSDGFAPMVDGANQDVGRSPENRSYSEHVFEHEGYYEYDIQLSLTGEAENEADYKYLRRTYYKYYELKKELREGEIPGTSKTEMKEFSKTSTGIWLYFSSNSSMIPEVNQADLIDVFTELVLEDTKPYNEVMFGWVMSSEGVAVAGDSYSGVGNFQAVKDKFASINIKDVVYKNDKNGNVLKDDGAEKIKKEIKNMSASRSIDDGARLTQIKNHSAYNYQAISDPANFELVYFSRRATIDGETGDYDWYNLDCPLVIMAPDYNKLIAKIVQITGHLEYAKGVYDDYDYWNFSRHYKNDEGFPCLGIKAVRGGENVLKYTNECKTYKDTNGDAWPSWFVRKTYTKKEFEDIVVNGSNRVVVWAKGSDKWNKYLKDYKLTDKYGYSSVAKDTWKELIFDHKRVNKIKEQYESGELDEVLKDGDNYTMCFGQTTFYFVTPENIGNNSMEGNSTNDGSTKSDAKGGDKMGNSLKDDSCVMLRKHGWKPGMINYIFWDTLGMGRTTIKGEMGTYEYSSGGYPVMTVKEDGPGVYVPREFLRTFQVFYKTRENRDVGEFVRYVKEAHETVGPITCGDISSSNYGKGKDFYWTGSNDYYPTVSDFNEMIANGETQKVLEYYAVMFAASCEFLAWEDYGCDALQTEITGWDKKNYYSTYPTAIITTTVKDQKPIKVLMGKGNSIEIVDLYKAFGVSNTEMFEIAKVYKEGSKDGNILNVENFKNIATTLDAKVNLSDEQLEMVLQALNGEQFTGALTETEISAGLVDMPIVNEQTKAYQKAKEKEEKAAESESENSENLENSNIENDDSDSESLYSTGAMTELETSFVPYVTVVRRYNESEYEFDKEAFPDLIEYNGSNGEAVVEKIGMKI